MQTVNSGETVWFGGHYRVDFIGQQGDRPVPVDLVPDNRVSLDVPLDGAAGTMRVRMEQIVWDDVEISHNAPGDLTTGLRLWFEHWYDPDDRRKAAESGGAVDVIHALGIFPASCVSISVRVHQRLLGACRAPAGCRRQRHHHP